MAKFGMPQTGGTAAPKPMGNFFNQPMTPARQEMIMNLVASGMSSAGQGSPIASLIAPIAGGIVGRGVMKRGEQYEKDEKARKASEHDSAVDRFMKAVYGDRPSGGSQPPGRSAKYDAMKAHGGPTVAAADAMNNDREILARTIRAEAGGESFDGKLAVGAVINNRRAAGGYGDGFKGVIMKPGQFSAWNSVTGYAGGEGGLNMDAMTPSAEDYRAADMILSGQYEDPTRGATHYYNPAAATPKWGMTAGGDWDRIGNHVFGTAGGPRISRELIDLATDPTTPDGVRNLAGDYLAQQMKPSDPMDAIRYQNELLDLAERQAPKPQYRVIGPDEAVKMGLPSGTYQQAPNGQVTPITDRNATVGETDRQANIALKNIEDMVESMTGGPLSEMTREEALWRIAQDPAGRRMMEIARIDPATIPKPAAPAEPTPEPSGPGFFQRLFGGGGAPAPATNDQDPLGILSTPPA